MALGVLNFLQFNFEKAQLNFKTAIKLKPNDATLWNKYGASLTQGFKIE